MMSQLKMWSGWLLRLGLATVLVISMAGCLSLEEETAAGSATSPASDVVISGSVGDGPVIGATITVFDVNGDVVGEMISDTAASFRTTFKLKGNQYPLRLVVSGGTDLVTGVEPDFEMVSVMLRPSDKQVNINPFTTFIVLLAEKMPGGLDSASIEAARTIVIDRLGFGLNPGVIPDPITTVIDGTNVAHLIKASEAMGEMVRRTRDLIMATGKSASGDSVLQALVADLSDGVVDGLGASGANPLVASVANVVSGQVLVEALSNNLRVGGVIATSIMDQSIKMTRSGGGGYLLTESVAINEQMLSQASIGVAAARVIDSSIALANVADSIASLSPGSLPGQVVEVLPAESSLALDNAVSSVATATSSDVSAINQVVASGGSVSPPPPGNTAPVISGVPAAVVSANNVYGFQPEASDSDGDNLLFMIVNKPSWASFSEGNGRLSGTPSESEVGSYEGVVISVTDGTDTASLAAFSIQVDPAPVSNTPPSITGIPTASVTATNSYKFQPAAQDADGDTLSFSITNKPSWAGFSTSTGLLSGIPADTDTGTYGGITISVTDGTDSVSLAAFSIMVNPAPVQTSSMTLTWVAPVARADGSPLSLADIGGYRIYYGTTAGSYPNVVDITDGTTTSVSVPNLPAGTYYAVMSTYDMGGLEGPRSAPVSKTVQ